MLDFRGDRSRRKLPRLFLAFREEASTPLSGIDLRWPDGTVSSILDMSEAGLVVSATGAVSKYKLGQSLEVSLRLKDRASQVLKVSVLRITAKALLLSIESLTIAGRLKLDQEDREKLIRTNWRRLPAAGLPLNFANSEWWHSVFDTNLWLWRDAGGKLERFILEFESVAMVFDSKAPARFLKSPSAFDESKGYAAALNEPLPHKVEVGHNWSHRLAKAFEFSSLPSAFWPELSPHLPRTDKSL